MRAVARAYAAEMHSGFPDLRQQLPMDFARRLPLPELRDATRAQIARILEAWEEARARHGGADGFLFRTFSIADCMYAPVVSRFATYGVALPPRLQAYADKIMALPAMRDWAKRHRPKWTLGRKARANCDRLGSQTNLSWPANAGHPGDACSSSRKRTRSEFGFDAQNPTGWPAFAGHDI